MRKQLTTLAALALGLGLAGTAWGAAADYHSQSADPCAVCHSLASAKGWIDASTPGGANWTGREGPQKCYTCHSTGNTYGATDQVRNAFGNGQAAGVHMYDQANLPDNLGGTPMTMGSFFYRATDGNNMDCITCHDVHSRNVRPYLSNSTSIENLCIQCHGRTWTGTKADGNTNADGRSTHPQGAAYTFTGNNGETYPAAFVYRDRDATVDNTHNFGEVVSLSDFGQNWTLGAHTQTGVAGAGGVVFNCQTCHPVHGGDDYVQDATSGIREPEAGLLVASIVGSAGGSTANDKSPVCQACHRGGDTGETVQPSSLGLTAADHPIGVRNLAYITINKRNTAVDDDASNGTGAGTGWQRYWGGVTGNDTMVGQLPLCVTCHDVHGGIGGSALYRVSAQAYAPGGTQVPQTEANYCFTCHVDGGPQAHHSHKGNMAASQIQCEDCHGAIGSGSYQAHGDFFNGGFNNDGALTVDLPSAPNGAALTASISAADQTYNYKSGLCVMCHVPANPTAFRAYTGYSGAALISENLGEAVRMPSRHGNLSRGTASHQVLKADNNSIGQVGAKYAAGGQDDMGIYAATAAPGGANYNFARKTLTGINNFAKWGRDGTLVGNGYATVAAAAGDLIICESCHNVQFNEGQRRIQLGSPVPAGVTQYNAGYLSNLLLGLYEDDWGSTADAPTENQNSAGAANCVNMDSADTASALCAWCHPFQAMANPDATPSTTHIHGESNGYVDWGAGLEVAGTQANWGAATLAVTNLSVYGLRAAADFPSRAEGNTGASGWLTWRTAASDWTKFDCDACHRPHNAATNSTMIDNVSGGSEAAPLITERAGAIDTVGGSQTQNNPIMRVEMCERCHAVRAL